MSKPSLPTSSPTPGTSKLATSAHSSSAGRVLVHSTSVTEGINSRRGRVTAQSNHGKGPR